MPLLLMGSGSRLIFVKASNNNSKTITMSDLYTEKIRRYADLVVPVSACPFGEPVDNLSLIHISQGIVR